MLARDTHRTKTLSFHHHRFTLRRQSLSKKRKPCTKRVKQFLILFNYYFLKYKPPGVIIPFGGGWLCSWLIWMTSRVFGSILSRTSHLPRNILEQRRILIEGRRKEKVYPRNMNTVFPSTVVRRNSLSEKNYTKLY